jgi:two-component system, NtrC family, sensor kinase
MLNALFISAVHAIVVIDKQGTVCAVNPAAERLFDYSAEELVDENVRILMPEPYRSEHDGYLRHYLQTGERKIIGIGREIEAQRKDGTVFPIYLSISEFQHEGDLRFAGIIRDLTEQVQYETELELANEKAERTIRQLTKTQDQLVASQKLAALGELTAGIAHEIKNPLNFVSNFSETSIELLGELKEAISAALGDQNNAARQDIDELMADLTSDLDKIRTHAHRADGIVRSMLDHARGGEGAPVSSDINALVEEAFNLAYHGQRARDKSFQLRTERLLDGEAGKALIRRQEVIRALVNIMGNAFYAVSEKRKAGEKDYVPSMTLATLSRGDSVEIRIRDNGTGIDDELKAKLFEPFFSTKPAGDGTGLGLSLCYDIIKQQHGGSISIDSTPGSFTEFVISLPRNKTQPKGA